MALLSDFHLSQEDLSMNWLRFGEIYHFTSMGYNNRTVELVGQATYDVDLWRQFEEFHEYSRLSCLAEKMTVEAGDILDQNSGFVQCWSLYNPNCAEDIHALIPRIANHSVLFHRQVLQLFYPLDTRVEGSSSQLLYTECSLPCTWVHLRVIRASPKRAGMCPRANWLETIRQNCEIFGGHLRINKCSWHNFFLPSWRPLPTFIPFVSFHTDIESFHRRLLHC